MRIPFQRKLDEIFRSDRSVWLKIGCGVLVGLYFFTHNLTIHSLTQLEKAEDRSTLWRVALFVLLVAAVSGGLTAFLLSMQDRVKQRIARGEDVNFLVRAYLGVGIWSLHFCWCPTIILLCFLFAIVTH